MTKKIFKTPDELAVAAAGYFVAAAQKAIKAHGRFIVALSGGSTPSKMFTLLAQENYSSKINWKNVFVFWGDERMVPADDESNNSHVAKKLLLDEVDIPTENIFSVPTQLAPAIAAGVYEKNIMTFFNDRSPVFDLIFLGMGDNGHTASLFPHTTILDRNESGVSEVYVDELKAWRISFTASLINAAKEILFLVAGKDKAAMLKKILEGDHSPHDYPAQMIKPVNGKLIWYLDKAAASTLT